MGKLYLDAPNLGQKEKDFLNKVIDAGYVSTVGPFVPEFEEKFAKYIGAHSAVSIQSGTAAIYMSLYELGIGPGDEVIVPGLTFIASVNPVLYAGATPVIVDIDRETWNISPEAIEKAITKKTRAIIPVHLFGNPAKMEAILAIANKYDLYIIEDATESLGAIYKNKFTGTFGEFGCFSFNGNKIITTGGGGMIVSEDEKKIKHIKFLINQAKQGTDFFHPEMGFNFRMTNLAAGLGLAQFSRLEEFLQKKRKFREIYASVLSEIPWLKFQKILPEARSSNWFTCIYFEKDIDVAKLKDILIEKEIPCRRNFMPLDQMPYLKKFAKALPQAHFVFERSICLPCSALNSYEDVEKAAQVIYKVLKQI